MEDGEDYMKTCFKYYKCRKPQPELDAVLDFDSGVISEALVISAEWVTKVNTEDFSRLGLISPLLWKAFTLKNHPGFIFLRNPFTAAGQSYWARRCVNVWPSAGHRTNLHFSQCSPDGGSCCWTLNPRYCDDSAGFFAKLRWVTMGYHHNWNTKVYSRDDSSEFPVDLCDLSRLLVTCLTGGEFSAEAAIVNYYHPSSTLSAHCDVSEPDLTSPLLSLSLGRSAVFLLGGVQRHCRPSAIYLRSGDVVLMSGRSRVCYHAVPLILPTADSDRWTGSGTTTADVIDVPHYLSNNRVNISVRQVYPRNTAT